MAEIARRMKNVPKSFIREILKVTETSHVISFAGGLPNPETFPIKELEEACINVLETEGKRALQYASTEGFYKLREFISKRYMEKDGLDIPPESILITTGSQQALDLIGKVLINKGDRVVMEEPGYLGAIQAFSVFEPRFKSVKLNDDGIDLDALKKTCSGSRMKLFYCVPNFHNPSGITYSEDVRKKAAKILAQNRVITVEDNPYGELRFIGSHIAPIRKYNRKSILLGSFSKIAAPGLRLGWISAPPEIMDAINTAKQAADLHTNSFTQRVLYSYLTENSIDRHIESIKKFYKVQRDAMVMSIEKYFPGEVKFTRPQGGMFVWVTLPKKLDTMKLFNAVIKKDVTFVPGRPFYANGGGSNTLRLNYSACTPEVIEEGIKRMGESIRQLLVK
jgi:2-aminoadipate transaminase